MRTHWRFLSGLVFALVLGLSHTAWGQAAFDLNGPAPDLISGQEAVMGAAAALSNGNHPGGCADGEVGLEAGSEKEASLALEPGVAYIGKKIEIPLVFTILYDPDFPTEWYNWVRSMYFDDEANACLPNVTDGTLVTPESVMIMVDRLNQFYGRYHITFKLYDGVADPIRYIPTWAFSPSFYIGESWYEPWFRQQMQDAFGVPEDQALNIMLGMAVEGGITGIGGFPWDNEQGDPWMVNMDFRVAPGVLPDLVDSKATSFEDADITYPCELSMQSNADVLEHEVGHCLGLFHTWNNSTPSYGGDLVDDTPFETEPFKGDGILRSDLFAGFPTLDRNTVDDSWYWPNHKDPADPARNVMNYGAFHYRESELTPGQVENIFRFISRFRPQFVTKFKPLKPAVDRLLVYVDFLGEKFKKSTVANKADKGKKIPVYLNDLDTAADGYELLQVTEDFAALQLSGTTHLQTMAEDMLGPDMDQTSEQFTLSMWFKLDHPENCASFGSGRVCPLAMLHSLFFYAYPFSLDLIPNYGGDPNWGVLQMVFSDASGGNSWLGWYVPMAEVQNLWNHVAVTFDAQTGFTIYYNGESINTGVLINAHSPLTFLEIGLRWISSPSGNIPAGFNGSVSEIAFFNTALTPAEMADLIASGPVPDDLKGNYRP